MANRGRGRGPRPRPEEDWGGWEGGGYHPAYHPPAPPFSHHPPPPYGFFPNPTPQAPFQQGYGQYQQHQQMFRPRGNFQGGRGRPQQQQRPTPRNQASASSKIQQPPSSNEAGKVAAGEENKNKMESESKATDFPQVICFNCAGTGHYSSACTKNKVCFMCNSKDHVAENCPEWRKSHPIAQYFGSANQGLGFYHIDVAPKEGRFRHWAGLDNYGIFTVEEGELSEEEIMRALKSQVDKDWSWKLMKLEDYRYLVKFPPHKKIETIVIGKATYFYLKSDTVLASIRVWNGDIQPVGQLQEAWVQIKGVPSKWCDDITIRQIASSLGKPIEIDWKTIFNNFFSTIRVKIMCKDPKKIPLQRVVEMADQLFLLDFSVENVEQIQDKDGSEGGDEEDGHKDEEEEGDDLLDDNPGGRKTGPEDQPQKENKDSEANDKNRDATKSLNKQQNSQREGRVRKELVMEEDRQVASQEAQEHISQGINLLQAMELADLQMDDEVMNNLGTEDSEKLALPREWIYDITKQAFNEEKSDDHSGIKDTQMTTEELDLQDQESQDNNQPALEGDDQSKIITRKKKWGPVVTERRSKRGSNDGRTMLEKAKDIKAKANEGAYKEFSGSTSTHLEVGTELVNSVPNKLQGGFDEIGGKAETGSATKPKTDKLMMKKTTPGSCLSMESWLVQLQLLEEALGDQSKGDSATQSASILTCM